MNLPVRRAFACFRPGRPAGDRRPRGQTEVRLTPGREAAPALPEDDRPPENIPGQPKTTAFVCVDIAAYAGVGLPVVRPAEGVRG